MAARQDRMSKGLQTADESSSRVVGYGYPPVSGQFRSGQSGNPKGRPRNRRREIPYDAVLGQMVTVREDGKERRLTAAEAFLLQLTQKGLAGDGAAARASLEAIESARQNCGEQTEPLKLIITYVTSGFSTITERLWIAFKKYPTDEKRVRCELNSWIVQAALDRLGNRLLTEQEQREVFRNTRSPHKVKWPDWWTVRE